MNMPATNKKAATKQRSIHTNKFTQTEDYLADRYEFRLNIVSLCIEYRRIPEDEEKAEEFKPVNENAIFRELHKANVTVSMAVLVALLRSDFAVIFDPIDEYFLNLPEWDKKTDYIGELAAYVHAIEKKEWQHHFKKHLVRTYVCATNPKYFNKQALILVQPEQNSGKSTFLRFLCPPELTDYLAEDMTSDKDSRILLVKNFIINLDELAKWSKKDIDTIKSYFSKTQINERLPYDRKNSVLIRRASFFGSTNRQDFLTDETGSVRWLCFQVGKIDWSYTGKVDINKVWSQAKWLALNGFEFEMSPQEIQDNEIRNKKYFAVTIEIEYIVKFFEFDLQKEKHNFRTATEVMGTIYRLVDHRLSLNFIAIGKALTFLGCPKGKEYDRYGYYLFVRSDFKEAKTNDQNTDSQINNSSNNENNLHNLPF